MDIEAEQRVTAPGFLAGLTELPMDDLRARRSAAQDIEDSLSYLRRLVQGRLDIVRHEVDRRRSGKPADLSELVADLPETLGQHLTAPGSGRLPRTFGPADAEAVSAEVDRVLDAETIGRLPDLDDQALADVHERLEAMEQDVSARRRKVFDVLDAISSELTRRYRTGQASVDSLLD